MPVTKKPKKLSVQDYTMYDFIAMSQEDAGKVLLDECEKENPLRFLQETSPRFR